uniref:Uncharacterized protein n=1 Tax=Tanacetum cinerariifolium TaxID=118510 RepID=A0A699K2Y7_TANCI|nr:hypothetical protein [Tanacetum cinerariifolium]
MDGLLHIDKYCNDLRTLCLKGNQFNNKDGKWLHELALQKMGIESLDFRYFDIHDVKDLTLLAINCNDFVCWFYVSYNCPNLEVLYTDTVSGDMGLQVIGTHLKNLRDFKMFLSYRYIKTYLSLNNGIRAMLNGCSKLDRLSIRLQPRHRGLTYVGLGYIGKYGHNLRYLYLRYVGESDAGLVELSKGARN